jgi:hypothetical protein
MMELSALTFLRPSQYRGVIGQIEEGKFMTSFSAIRQAICFVALALTILASSASYAVPVTFIFQGVVTDVDALHPTPLPFSIQLGGPVLGKFTFEPVDVDSSVDATNTIQTLGAVLDLGSILLETSDYFLRVRNNSPMDDAPDQFTDDIWLGCSSSLFATCSPQSVPNTTDINWRFTLPLFGDGSVLDGADIPADPSVWNQLTPGYISLAFQETGVADVLRIVVKVDRFSVVPEPTSSMLAMAIFFRCVFIRHCPRRT